jgi:hypothetical protein
MRQRAVIGHASCDCCSCGEEANKAIKDIPGSDLKQWMRALGLCRSRPSGWCRSCRVRGSISDLPLVVLGVFGVRLCSRGRNNRSSGTICVGPPINGKTADRGGRGPEQNDAPVTSPHDQIACGRFSHGWPLLRLAGSPLSVEIRTTLSHQRF